VLINLDASTTTHTTDELISLILRRAITATLAARYPMPIAPTRPALICQHFKHGHPLSLIRVTRAIVTSAPPHLTFPMVTIESRGKTKLPILADWVCVNIPQHTIQLSPTLLTWLRHQDTVNSGSRIRHPPVSASTSWLRLTPPRRR
jgi:hypothetical protein